VQSDIGTSRGSLVEYEMVLANEIVEFIPHPKESIQPIGNENMI
jgi:hypothetical protein